MKGILLSPFNKSCIPVKSTSGIQGYLKPGIGTGCFPGYQFNTVNVTNNYYNCSIVLGSGNTQPTEDDYILTNKITSGLTVGSVTVNLNIDSDGNPYKEFIFLVTNTSQDAISIREIGYVGQLDAPDTVGSNSTSISSYLLDHSLLDTPVTIQPSESSAIKYVLKSNI